MHVCVAIVCNYVIMNRKNTMDTTDLKFTLNDKGLKVLKTCLAGLFKVGHSLMVLATSTEVCSLLDMKYLYYSFINSQRYIFDEEITGKISLLQIRFSSCNSNRSAFLSVVFQREYFDSYEINPSSEYLAVLNFKVRAYDWELLSRVTIIAGGQVMDIFLFMCLVIHVPTTLPRIFSILFYILQNLVPFMKGSRVRYGTFSFIGSAQVLLVSLVCDNGAPLLIRTYVCTIILLRSDVS